MLATFKSAKLALIAIISVMALAMVAVAPAMAVSPADRDNDKTSGDDIIRGTTAMMSCAVAKVTA